MLLLLYGKSPKYFYYSFHTPIATTVYSLADLVTECRASLTLYLKPSISDILNLYGFNSTLYPSPSPGGGGENTNTGTGKKVKREKDDRMGETREEKEEREEREDGRRVEGEMR